MDMQTEQTMTEETVLTEEADNTSAELISEESAATESVAQPQPKPLPKWVVPTAIAAVAVLAVVLFFTVFGGYKLFMNDEQLIQARFDAVAAAMSNGDIEGVTESMEPALRDEIRNRDGYEELKALYRVLGASVDFTFEVTELTIDGDRATATLTVTGTSFGNTESRTLDDMPLVKTHGDWFLTDLGELM